MPSIDSPQHCKVHPAFITSLSPAPFPKDVPEEAKGRKTEDVESIDLGSQPGELYVCIRQ